MWRQEALEIASYTSANVLAHAVAVAVAASSPGGANGTTGAKDTSRAKSDTRAIVHSRASVDTRSSVDIGADRGAAVSVTPSAVSAEARAAGVPANAAVDADDRGATKTNGTTHGTLLLVHIASRFARSLRRGQRVKRQALVADGRLRKIGLARRRHCS